MPRISPALWALFTRLGVEENVLLKHFSTLKVGGPARFLATANTVEQVATLQLAAKEHDLRIHILSGGSNTLFSDDGFVGLILRLGAPFDFIRQNGQKAEVGARTSFAKLTKAAVMRGFLPAVGWCGTPGLVGGALRMNAGTRLGEIKDAVQGIFGVRNGKEEFYPKDSIGFGYRRTELPDDLIIYKAELYFDTRHIGPRDAVLKQMAEYRQRRKATQPIKNSLGSFFKNPYPDYAAQLIEKCNLKGLKYRGAQISPLHANFIINTGDASANDIYYIASIAQQAVFENFGIHLHPEVRMVGSFPALSKDSMDTDPLAIENS